MQSPLPARIPPAGVEMECLTLPLQDPPATTRRNEPGIELAPLERPAARKLTAQEPCHLIAFVWIAGVTTVLGTMLAGSLVVGLDYLLDVIAHTIRSMP